MSAFALTQELKLENVNFDATLLPKHNPYVGYFPSIWPMLHFEPLYKDASTQTETTSYFTLGKKIAEEYGDEWELLLSAGPTVGGTTK